MCTPWARATLREGDDQIEMRLTSMTVPDFGALSFEDAIRLFKQWGFQVEPGPRPEDVTLILEGSDYRTYSVHDAHMLPKMAAVALRARWQNGTLMRQHQQRDGNQRAVSREFAELVC